MAQKNFFVDINLQGNKLANSTVGANSSMTVGGSFQYAEGRLEYFDGATVQEVANLSDISAITGGLIFQGGYDPTTNTPDITDGTALKGFFWAATNAGSFLGESVQVGDSIIAKVDNAGATINDWLILQGNVVIATDTVDGIVRLGTQTEVNDGTEGGAVVVTPATLQGKIDAQITPEISSKLPLAGGTMSGAINMGSNNITNANSISGNVLSVTNMYAESIGGALVEGNLNFASGAQIINLEAPTAGGNAANKTYVDTAASTAQANAEATAAADATAKADAAQANAEAYADSLAPNYDPAGSAAQALTDANAYTDAGLAEKLDLAGGTMAGAIDMDGNSILDANSITANSITSGTIIVNNLQDLDAGDITFGSNLSGNNTQTIINLPAPTNGGDATNKTYVDTTASTAETNANAYTNSFFFNQGFYGASWTLEAGVYSLEITHSLNTATPKVAIADTTGVTIELIEFQIVIVDSMKIKLQSNIAPPAYVDAGVSK